MSETITIPAEAWMKANAPVDIHDCQDWIRAAPLKEVQELLWWAQGVLDVRVLQQNGRKKRSDAGKSRKADPLEHL